MCITNIFNMSNIGWSQIWICTLLFYGVNMLSPAVKQGFNDKFMSTRQQLTNTIYQNSREQNNLKINMSTVWSHPLEIQRKINKAPTIIRTNKRTIMVDNLDLWVFQEEKLEFKTSLERIFDHDVQFVKGFDWQDRLFLLVCFQNSVCSLHSATPDFVITYHQSISDNGDPTDAQFFVQQGKLFLTILFHERSISVRLNRTSSRLRIYQWHNLYMDPEFIPDITSTATCITLFKYEKDIILVLGCPGEESLKFPSQVWSRKPNGEMALVQFIPTDRPVSISHFMERGENFIFILEKDRETSIYWWEGNEFVRWLSVEGMEKYFQVTVSNSLKYTTFLTFYHANALRIFLMTSVKLEKIYETEFSSGDMTENISILSVTAFEENNKTYMLVITKAESQVFVSLHEINVQIMMSTATEPPNNEAQRSDSVKEALDTVFRGVASFQYKLKNLEILSSSVLLTNKDFSISHGVVIEEIQVDSGEVHELIHSRRDIVQFMGELYSQYVEPIAQEIHLTWRKLQTTTMEEDRSLIFQGNVIIREAKINSLSALLINNNIFEPRSFLSVTNPSSQRLKNMKAKKMKVDWLVIEKLGDKKLEDFYMADSRVRVPISVASLDVKNLNISEGKTINNISATDLANRMVTIETEEDAFNRISQIGDVKIPGRPQILKLLDNTVIQNLNVDFIDNVPVNRTLTSVFVRGINNVISGDVHFQAGVQTKEMVAVRFHSPEKNNDYSPPPPPQLNMSPSHSNLYSPPMMFPVPPPPRLNIPPAPLNIYPQFRPQIPVYRPYPPQVRPFIQFRPFILDGRRMKRDNFEDDKIVIRKAKVKIIGNLKVARLLFRNSSMEVNNRPVPTEDLGKIFWTRKTPQEINGSVHFTQGISIESDLESPVINGKNLSCYASRSSKFNSSIFENIHVTGNITLKDNGLEWTPESESQSSVFKTLNVRHLNAKTINGEQIENILQTSSLHGEGIKIITGNLKVDGDFEALRINSIDVKKKFNSAVTIDKDFELNNVEFKNISGNNIHVNNLNNNSIEHLKRFTTRETSSVFIHGDIHLSNLSKVMSINSQPANFTRVVNKRKGAVIYGKKKFNAQVIVLKDLKINNINSINLDERLRDLLRVSEDQEVSGFYTSRTAQMKSNFTASSINGVRLSDFVFTDQPQLKLLSKITLQTLAVDGDITSASLHGNCLLPKVEDEIVFEQSSNWSSIDIAGDSNWPEESGGQLQHLFESAVTLESDQDITGNVTIKLLSARKVQINSLNDKNISFVFQDTFSRQKENQVISGKKTFLKPFKCKNIEIKGDAQLKLINNININDIDERLVRSYGDGKEIVTGRKTFLNGFKAFSLECSEGINGVKAENIVSRKFSGEVPAFIVQSLKVLGPLFVEKIDDLNLKDFIKDCIYLNHTETQRILGQLRIKGNVSLLGNVTSPSINNISLSDVVYVDKKNPFTIRGCKRFSSDVIVESDPNIRILNNRNLTKTFRDNVKIDQNVTINGSVIFEAPIEMDTIYSKEYFVGQKQLVYLNKTFKP